MNHLLVLYMVEVLLGIASLAGILFVFHKITTEFFRTIKTIVDSVSEMNKRQYEMITGMQIDHEKQIAKMQESFLKSIKQPVIQNKKTVEKVVEENNQIEQKEEDTVEITEAMKIPIMDGMKVKFDDDPEILPIGIS